MIDGNDQMISAIRSGDGNRAAKVTADLVERAWRTTRQLFLADKS